MPQHLYKHFTMKKYSCLLFLAAWGIAQQSNAQVYAVDAARYTSLQVAGTSRIQAIGGAATALGGDISAAYYNPAGLGFNRKSEFSFAPSLNFLGSDATYYGNLNNDGRLNFNISHLGLALAFPKDGSDSDFKGGTFAITMTRNNNFNNNTTYSANNSANSIVDYFIGSSAGTPVQEFDSQLNNVYDLRALGYKAYLTYYDPEVRNGQVIRHLYNSDIPVGVNFQRERLVQSGGQYQINASYGGNYKDLLYFGAGIGFQTFSFEQTKTFYEKQVEVKRLPNGNLPNAIFNDLTLTETLRQDVAGVNFQAGLIFRPLDYLRIGANIVSPTWLSASESYTANLNVNYNNYNVDNAVVNNVAVRTSDLVSDFNIVTPMRLSGGIAGIIGKYGFVSADVEYVDFRSMKLNANFDMSASNNAIKNNYRSVLNIRAGAEARLDKFRLRGGFGYYPDSKVNSDLNTITISGGLGYMTKKMFIDFSIVNISSKSSYSPYPVDDAYRAEMERIGLNIGATPVVSLSNSQTRAIATIGFYF
jgi:hypothetical protein